MPRTFSSRRKARHIPQASYIQRHWGPFHCKCTGQVTLTLNIPRPSFQTIPLGSFLCSRGCTHHYKEKAKSTSTQVRLVSAEQQIKKPAPEHEASLPLSSPCFRALNTTQQHFFANWLFSTLVKPSVCKTQQEAFEPRLVARPVLHESKPITERTKNNKAGANSAIASRYLMC